VVETELPAAEIPGAVGRRHLQRQQRRQQRQRIAEEVLAAAAVVTGAEETRPAEHRTTTRAVPYASKGVGRRTAGPGSTATGHRIGSRVFGGRSCSTRPVSYVTTGTWSSP